MIEADSLKKKKGDFFLFVPCMWATTRYKVALLGSALFYVVKQLAPKYAANRSAGKKSLVGMNAQ